MENVKEPDPGLGCNTSNIILNISNTAGLLFYNPYHNAWELSLDLPCNIAIVCFICDNGAGTGAVTAVHSINEIINVTVSGKIKNSIINQPPMTSHPGYKDIYVITLDMIQ